MFPYLVCSPDSETRAQPTKPSPPEGNLSGNSNLAMTLKFTTSYLEDALAVFRYYKKLAERAMEQVTDEQLFAVSTMRRTPSPSS